MPDIPASASKHPALKDLTHKQRLFVLAYLEHFNASKAARDAGYSKKCTGEIGYDNLNKPQIRKAIAALLDSHGATPARLEQALSEMVFDNDVTLYADWISGKKSLEDIKAEGVNTKLLQEFGETGKSRKVKGYSRLDALDKLMRVRGMITDKKQIDLSGGVNVDFKNMTEEQIKAMEQATGTDDADDDSAPE